MFLGAVHKSSMESTSLHGAIKRFLCWSGYVLGWYSCVYLINSLLPHTNSEQHHAALPWYSPYLPSSNYLRRLVSETIEQTQQRIGDPPE